MASQLFMNRSSRTRLIDPSPPSRPAPPSLLSPSSTSCNHRNTGGSGQSLVVPLYTPLYNSYRRSTPSSTSTSTVTPQPRSRSNSLQFRGNFHVEETETGIKIQIRQPHLISVRNNDDSTTASNATSMNKTSIKIYPLKVGRTRIGSCAQRNDIYVQGRGIEPDHCYIENTEIVLNDRFLTNDDDTESCFVATLYPLAKLCAVDGVLIDTPYVLSTGLYFFFL